LNDSEVGSVFEKVGRKGVAKKVGIDVLIDACLLCAFLYDLPNAVGGEWAAANREEDM